MTMMPNHGPILLAVLLTASNCTTISARNRATSFVRNALDSTPPLTCVSLIAIGASTDSTDSTSPFNFNSTSTDERFVCLLPDGSDRPLSGTPHQIDQLRLLLNNGTLISGLSTVHTQVRTASRSSADSLLLPEGPIQLLPTAHRRLLTNYNGLKPVLVVRVIDRDGLSPDDSPLQMSDAVFGTFGDTSTMAGQFAACSFDALEMVPADGVLSEQAVGALSAPGVVEVELDVSIREEGQSGIRAEVRRKLEEKLGMGLPGRVEHYMIVVEGCYKECGW